MSTTKPSTKTAKKTSKPAAKSGIRKPKSASMDAINLLMQDHAEVKNLFLQYDELTEAEGSDADKELLAHDICMKLTAHATAEEEIFYPAAREVLDEDVDLVDEADVEHASAKDLIAQILSSSPAEGGHYDARVKVLGEYIDHHVKEEEDEMFPKIAESDLDLAALGEEIAARKEELLAELGEAETEA